MRCMVIVKATKASEQGVMPSPELLAAMGNYNEELMRAGIIKEAGGLRSTSHAKRVRFSGSQRIVIDGPFSPVQHQIAGYWLWQVKSMDEAVEWVKRCPNPMLEGVMKLYTYLNYGGNCQEAFRFYELHLGGKITMGALRRLCEEQVSKQNPQGTAVDVDSGDRF